MKRRKAHPAAERIANGESPRVRAALDRLFASAPNAFTALRAELAREAKAAGDAEAASLIAKARRPNRVAWALNRLAHEDARRLHEVFAAFDQANAPATKRDASTWKRAVSTYRDGVAALARAVRDDLAGQGLTADAGLLRGVTETIQAAAADPEMRAQLLAGHLERTDEAADPLAGLGGPTEKIATHESKPPAQHAREREHDRERAHEPKRKPQAAAETQRQREMRERRERKEREEAHARAKREAERARAIERARKHVAAAEDAKRRADEALEAARAELRSLLDERGVRP